MPKRIISLALMLILALGAVSAGAEGAGPLAIEGDYRHILLVGLDARPGESTGRSDVMILLTLDGEHRSLKMVSFLRDLYVPIEGHGHNRLNSAWVYGGPELLLDTIEQNFGLRVEYYAAVDFSVMIDVVDAAGGLEIDISSQDQMALVNEMLAQVNDEMGLPREGGRLTRTGRQVLYGRQVMAYMRYRKTESDFSRTQRQRQVLNLLMEKAAGLPLTRLASMAASVLTRIRTNMTLLDVLGLLPTALKLRSLNVEQLHIPRDGEYEMRRVDGMEVLWPDMEGAREALVSFLTERKGDTP